MMASKSQKKKTIFFQSLLAIFLIVIILHMMVDTFYIALNAEEKIVARDERLKQESTEYFEDNFYFDKSIARYPGPSYQDTYNSKHDKGAKPNLRTMESNLSMNAIYYSWFMDDTELYLVCSYCENIKCEEDVSATAANSTEMQVTHLCRAFCLSCSF